MPRIDDLYNSLNRKGLYTKSPEEFKKQFSTPEAISQLHFALKEDKLFTGSLADFNNQFFSDQLKKKEEALPSMPSAEGGFLDITPTPQDRPLVSFGEVMPSEAEQSPIFQQYQEQKAQRPQGLEYGLPEQKPATPFVQETKKGLFGEELPVQAQPTVPQKPLEVVQSLLPYNFEDLTEAEKITALTQASNSPEATQAIQAEIEAERAKVAAEEAKNVSDLEKLTRAGIASGRLANKIAYLETIPTAPTSSDFFEIASLMKEIQENTVEDEGGTIGFFKHLPGVVYQSLVSMATAAPTGAAGAAAGGVAGSVAGPGGMIAGLISGFGGGSSLALEYSSSLMSSLQEAGVNVTSARELSEAFNSPEKMSMAREYALKRGIPVAVFDAISGGIAGKFFKPVAGATAKQVMNAALKETGLQSGLGGLGELSAQLIADGEVNMRDVLYEMVAEPVTSIPEIAAGRMSSNTKSLIAKEVATPQQKDALSSIDTKLREVNNAQISTTDETTKSVLGDVATKLEEEKSAVLSEIEKNFDFMTDEEAANVLSASREIKTLQDKAEQVRNNPEMTDDQKKLVLSELKRQAETFDNQRKEIIQNAVQKQATSEVPVQPEARVGEEVAQGAPEAKPEVVTEEGVQEEVTIDTPAIVANTKPEVDVVVAAAPEVETGQTFNSDGTVYSNGGLVVPVTSENITQQELTPERIAEFVEANKAKIGSNAVKVGIYKFPNSNKVSLDLNIVVPKENRAAALEFGKMAGQESLFDLDTFENVKTGADGMNPMSFTDDQFKQIAKSLSEGKVPDFMMAPVDQATVGKTIQNTAQSLQVAFPEVEFIVGDNLEDTRARIVEALTPRVGMEKAQEVANDFKDVRGQALFAGERPVAIVVDKAAANTRTAGHEAWEVMLNDAFGKNPEKFAEFRKSIDRQLRLSGFNDIAEELRAFSETYSKEGNEVVFREYMAEFGGMLVEGGFDIQNLTPQQKSLLQKIKDIINDFAMQLTGKEVFLKDATAENIIDFMSTISQKVAKGETVEEFFEGATPQQAKDIRSVNQKKAIEILDGPKFDNNKKEDVASFLNGLRESVVPPDSPKEQLIERFINNVYEEVGYYLYSKGDPRAAGLTWYIEDMVEFSNKIKVLLPELSNQDQYKLFLSILAFTSSGTNPNQNLLYAYNLWNNSNDPKNFDFSKNWGDSKMSFIDKKGKAIANGSIIKETSSQYTIQLVDSVGKLVVDSKGNPKTQVIAKKSLKEGYPKSTGYTNRGEIVVGQLEKLEKLYKDLGSIEEVVKWLETPHPIAELREYNQSVPDVNGNGPGVTNKQYDPAKNAEGQRNGAFVFGEKIGSFYQNMIGIGETITMDLWWSRTWNRYMGTMLNTVSGKTVIQETPRTDRERNIMREAVKMVADDLNLQVSELQAAIWYFEQELWTKSGNASPSYSYVTAVDDLTKKLKVDEATRTKLQEARADLSAAEKRKQAAAERAASVVAGKGGKGTGEQITARAQKKAPAAISEDVYKYLTEDENGNIVFHHYSSSQRNQIKPSSGQGSLLTSKEEQQALSSVGGLAMYYAQEGQKEPGVGNELHTVVVPRDKVYDIRKDPMNFYDEAKERFLEHMNRNNTGKPIEYAFSPNYQVAWITKVAGENGFDMTVAQWKNKADYRAQSTKTLTPEAENIKMKPIEGEIEVGDLVQIYGQESVITDIDENGVLSYVQKGSSGKFDLPMSKRSMRMGKATLLDKGPYIFDEAKQEPVKETITARAQKINYKDLPGYDRMRNKVDGIIEKATKRGATKARIADDVINYVQKSAVYERANDSQRDQMIRDLKKELGQRVKSAPKAERLLGTIKDAKKVTVDEMMALKEKIKAEAKAAKDAVAFINGIRARIAEEIKAMEKSGVLSAKQVQTIINKASKVNLTRPDAVNNFVDYMEKVFKNAEYGEKLSQSNTLQKRIKNLSKSDKVAAGTKAVAKQFAQIEPRRVSNIEEYLEYASALYNAMKPTAGRVTEEGVEISFKSAVEYDKVQDYSNEEIKRQEKQKVDEILARNEDLVMAGVLTEDMNIDEIKKIIDAINSEDPTTLPPAEKEKMIRDYVKKAFGYYRTIALSMIQRGVDPFTGEEIELTESQKKLARRFLEVDTDMMPLKEAYAAVEAIDNFIVNKVTDGMAATIADYVGQVNAKNLAKEGYRGKPLRLFYSKNVGRAWAEQIEQLDLMVQRMFGGVNRALAFMRASGANAFKVGKTTTQVQLNNILNKYAAKFGDVKGFRDLENVMERGVLAFVSRSVNENSTKQQNEFERRKALVEETLAYMKTGTEKEQSQAIELQKVYDNILKGSSSIDQVEAKVKDFNKDAVKFWVDEWSSKYDELQDLSRNVYNVVLGSDINYTPDRFKRVSGKDVAEAQWGESMFANSSDYFDTKEAGVLMENKRIQTLGKRPSRIVSFDFDVNMSNSMYDALMDINTAEATRQMKSFFNSDGFEKIVPTKEDRDLMVDRMKKFVIRSKRKDYVSQDQLSGVFKAMNTIAGLGAGRALGGILQAPKQTIGVAFNTMINSGGRLSVVDAIQANQFINDSGYAIALRGIASNADIQSINKILEKASQTKGDAALRLLNKASEMWLNTFLVKPDVWIARTSWISYYKQQLDKMGYDTKSIDWSSHKLNKEAADYAQAMLDRQQNYSDSDLAGEFFASKEPMKMFLRKTFFPFMTFVMNQKSRMYADLSIIGNKDASTQEKINAGKSLTGMAIEMGVYSAMSMFFANLLTEMTDALWGYDEDEEDKKKRMKRSSQYYAKNIVMDVLSPLPVTNEVVRITINKGLEAAGIDKDTFELPKNFESGSWMSDFGMNAIAAEKMLSAYDKLHMAATGEYTKQDFFGNDVTMKLDEEAKQKMAYVALADFMYSLGLAPTEIGSMANKATGRAKKTGKKVKESGSQPGGVIEAKVIEAK